MSHGPLHALTAVSSVGARESARHALERVVLRALADPVSYGPRMTEVRAASATALTEGVSVTDVVTVCCDALRQAARATSPRPWESSTRGGTMGIVEFLVRTVWQGSDEGLREGLLADLKAQKALADAVQACALTVADEAWRSGGFFQFGAPCMLH